MQSTPKLKILLWQMQTLMKSILLKTECWQDKIIGIETFSNVVKAAGKEFLLITNNDIVHT